MDWRSRAVFFIYISVAISSSNEEKSEPSVAVDTHDQQEHLSNAINDFGFKLLKQQMKFQNDSNIVMSPVGVAGLLAMTLLGSAGKAYNQLATMLGFSQDILRNRAHHEELGELLSVLSNSSSKTSYADAIFVSPSTRVRPMYRDYLRRVYRGDALVAPFREDAPAARDTINEWIRNNTNGKIEEFLKEPLPMETKVVLLSALYFSGQWAQPFASEYTAKMPFKSPTGNVMADLMLNLGEFKYVHSVDEDLHMIALPYNDSTTMYALKPLKRSSLPELLTRLNYTTIDRLITRMTTNRAVIRFPKMDIKSSARLEDSLKAMGLGAMFSPSEANFALMIEPNKANSTDEELLMRIKFEERSQDITEAVNRLPNPGAYVDTVLHDVKISINEYGTEAVAATGGFLTRSAEQFYADSPFYMFIRNEKTKLVTFSAAIFNPTI